MSLYVVQPEPFERVARDVIGLFNLTRGLSAGFERFRWLYLENPDGPAVVWTVRSQHSGELVGFTAGLPRRVYVQGRAVRCWNTSDFSIAPSHRTLGIAVKLRRAATEGVDSGQVEFLYGHPNARMALVHQRAGHVRVGTMQRYACPIRSLPYLRRRLRVGAAARTLAPMADLLLRAAHPWTWRRPRFSVRLKSAPRFDRRFDGLDERCRLLRPIMGVRDSRYLTWRYAANPLYSCLVATASEGGELFAYAIAVPDQDVLQLKDLLWDPTSFEALEDVLAELLRWAYQSRFSSISLSLLVGHPAQCLLEQNFFRPRDETSDMYAYGRQGSAIAALLADTSNWFIFVGDRDV